MKKEKESKKCAECEANIPAARLQALPDTKYCVKCSPKHPEELKALSVDLLINIEDCLDIVAGDD